MDTETIHTKDYYENRLSKPEKQKIIHVFGGKSYFFIVPKYQRSYIWSDKGKSEQLIQFWDDFLDTEKSEGNLPFLGNLILSRTDENSVFEVVDGQQRLITLQIFFRVLLSKIKELAGSNEGKYKQIIDSLTQTLVSYDEYGENEMLKVTAGKDIDKYFKELILNGHLASEPTKRDDHWHIWNAYIFFIARTEEYISAPKTADDKIKLLLHLFKRIGEVEFIIIILRNQADAYEVFESFNAKGARLNTADLFKNLILSKLDRERDAPEKWDQIIASTRNINANLPQFTVDTYLRYYWSSKNGYVNPRSLYREIKEHTTDYQGLLNDLVKLSEKLSLLLDYDNLTPQIVSSIFKSDTDPGGKESNKIAS